MSELLSVWEAAKLLGISKVAVIKQIKDGKLKAEKVGNIYVINQDDLNILSRKEISEDQKDLIEETVKKIIHDYKETLRLLKDS